MLNKSTPMRSQLHSFLVQTAEGQEKQLFGLTGTNLMKKNHQYIYSLIKKKVALKNKSFYSQWMKE